MRKRRVGRPRTKGKTVARSGDRTTSVTFTSDDLTALTRYVMAGQVMLQDKHPVMAELKAASSRLGLSM